MEIDAYSQSRGMVIPIIRARQMVVLTAGVTSKWTQKELVLWVSGAIADPHVRRRQMEFFGRRVALTKARVW
jgi:hypothetical protein